MYKNRTILKLILSSLIMLLSVGTLVLFAKIIANKNSHTSAVLLNLSNKMAKKDNIEILKKKIAEVEETRETINGYFVDSTKIDYFVDYLENLGTSFGTQIKVESFEPSAKDKNTLSVRLSCKGTFSNIMNTILLLENAPYNIHITRTSFSQQLDQITTTDKGGKKTTNSIPTWQANISFTILSS
jgi:hypothetical protein